MAGALAALKGGRGAGGLAGSAGMSVPMLKAPKSGLPGVAGRLADTATSRYAAALNDKLGAAGAGAGGGGGATPGGGAAAPAQVRAWVAAGLRLGGFDSTPANVAAQTRLTMGESGGDPTVRQKIHDVNSTNGSGGAVGFAQMLQSTFDAYKVPGHGNILNPVDNTAASVRYQRARYGHLVGHPGYERGGRLGRDVDWGGWNAKGGDYTVDRPTLFGAGEKGKERVSITPAGQSSGGPVSITNHVAVHAGGHDTKRVHAIVDRRLDEFARLVEDEILSGSEIDDASVIG